MPRMYSIAEANALVPELTALLSALQAQAGVLATYAIAFNSVRERVRLNGHAPELEHSAREAAEVEKQARAHLARLRELGIELKDVESGLIDFYHERDGRVVYLCWKLGEPAVGYWHELDTGFAGRQPLG